MMAAKPWSRDLCFEMSLAPLYIVNQWKESSQGFHLIQSKVAFISHLLVTISLHHWSVKIDIQANHGSELFYETERTMILPMIRSLQFNGLYIKTFE